MPDLERFLNDALKRGHRRLGRNPDGTFSFNSPESWRSDRRMRRSYENLSLSRTQTGTTLGIGHPAMDRLLADAQAREAFIGIVEGLSEPLLVYTVRRKFDRAGERMRLAAIGIEGRQILQPAALLSRLSNLRPLTSTPQKRSIEANLLSCAASNLIDVVEDQETLLLQGILLPSEGHIADVMN